MRKALTRPQRAASWSSLVAAAIAGATQVGALSGQARAITPDDGVVSGSRLAPFHASWQSRALQEGTWTDRSVVTERLERSGNTLVRTQDTDMGSWGMRVTVELDRQTLRPLSLRRTLLPGAPEPLLEQLEAAGFAGELEFTFSGSDYRLKSTAFSGEVETTEGDFGGPYFDGATLGLLIAALPHEQGSVTRLPVIFIDARAGDVTRYWVEARVGGSETIKGISTVRVDVAWLDYETDTVTSAPGPDAPGGAYWVTAAPPDGLPHVPRYKNDTFDIQLIEGQ